ncbi:MAG: PRD domain-containing protein [Erysipelotrichaceae bacterium]
MKVKHLQLLRCLSEQNDWITAATLSSKLNVSLRSVKNYVADISVLEPHLIKSSRQGYLVNREKVFKVFSNIDSGIPQTSTERVNYIINRLIHEANVAHYQLNIYDLSEDISVSTATLKIDIQKAKKTCGKFDLILKSTGDYISLEGLEKNKRKILSSIMFDETKENFMNIKTIQNAFMDYDIEYIQKVIADTLKIYHYFINDYSLMNLVLHVTIAIDRMNNDYIYTRPIKNTLNIKSHEYELSLEIAKKLENHYHITYNENEIYELSLLLISSTTNLDYNNVSVIDLEKTVGKECMKLTRDLVADMNAFYYVDLSDQEFLTRFTLHIKNLLIRAGNDHFSRNPLTESIKSSCPLIYECAVSMSNELKERTGYTINDDEIAYIAFHIGGALENQKNINNKVSCALLYPQYYDLNVKLTEKLSSEFKERLVIKTVLTKEQDISSLQVDLIISTNQINTYTPIPSIVISPFITNIDRDAIYHKLNEVNTIKKNRIFKEHLETIFQPDFFEKNINYENETEVINHICERMLARDFIDDDFQQEVFDREAMSSTAFHNIAIPHSMKMRSKKTSMYVIINEKGIHWGNNNVNIILLLSINRDERKIFHEIFDSLTTILVDEQNIKKVIQANTYKEFIELIINCQ